MDTILPKHWSEKKAAKEYGVRTQTMRKWRYLGKGPHYIKLPNGHVGYLPDDLKTWFMESRRFDPRARKPRRRRPRVTPKEKK